MEIHLRKAFFVTEKKIGPIKTNLRYDSIWSHHRVKEALIFRNQTLKKSINRYESVNPFCVYFCSLLYKS